MAISKYTAQDNKKIHQLSLVDRSQPCPRSVCAASHCHTKHNDYKSWQDSTKRYRKRLDSESENEKMNVTIEMVITYIPMKLSERVNHIKSMHVNDCSVDDELRAEYKG